MPSMQDELDAQARDRYCLVVLGLLALVLGSVKVWNELKMTRMYERQAVALEAIADRPWLEQLGEPCEKYFGKDGCVAPTREHVAQRSSGRGGQP